MVVMTKKKSAADKKRKSTNGSFDIKELDSKEMLILFLQDIKTSIHKLDNKIDANTKQLNDKIDRNFRWTIGIIITSLGITITGFMGLVTVILSKL